MIELTHTDSLRHTIFAPLLDLGVQRLLTVSNAGGSSILSEALSFFIVKSVFRKIHSDIQLHKTEMELKYRPGSKITDYTVLHQKEVIGCSVVRFFNYYNLDEKLSDTEIRLLLYKKLIGIIESTFNIINDHWDRQILHIFTPNKQTAKSIKRIVKELDDIINNTIIIVTIAHLPSIYLERGKLILNITEE